eukprot:TRINITY_DN75087_c0_g1_i1.p1 TRINITY_DN75087_c0_g1~~TRINITY_DN75087_c0_g1_i1.p1  ORF type:complete len:439 (+),score=112.07 TRINITY_DN75087_c0_g1_i1:35-1318(+)
MAAQAEDIRLDVRDVRLKAQEHAHALGRLNSDVLDLRRLEHRFEELRGELQAVDRERGLGVGSLQEWREHVDSRLTQISNDVHACRAAARGDLRRACEDIEEKIAEPGRTFTAQLKELEQLLGAELSSIVEKQETRSAELLRLIRDLDAKLNVAKQDQERMHETAMQHTDDSTAMCLRALDERAAAITATIEQHARDARSGEAEALADARRYTDDECAPLSVRIEDVAVTMEQYHQELWVAIEQASIEAKAAATFSTEMALKRVDDNLQAFVHKASDSLLGRIDGVAKDLTQLNGERQKEDIEAGFYSLLARDTIDVELRAMVDRALQRMQHISDDLSHRSCLLQEYVVHSETRLQTFAHDAVQKAAAAVAAAGASGSPACDGSGGGVDSAAIAAMTAAAVKVAAVSPANAVGADGFTEREGSPSFA